MPATLSRGYTFGATEQVTNAKLHSLVDAGSISGIDQSDMGSNVGIAQRGTSSPLDHDALWVDTNTDPPVLRHYDGTEWVCSGPYGVFTNKSGGTRSVGDVVVVDTANAGSFTTTTIANNNRVLGVVMASVANNADGIIALAGARVKALLVNGTTAVGDYLATSTTAGQASPSSSPGPGVFAIALASRTGSGTISEAVLIGGQATSSQANSPMGLFRKLKVTRPSASTVTVTADELILQDTSANTVRISSVSVTPNITVSGANGLDTGSEAASTWYFIWVIRKSSDGTVAGLLSTSSTSPTMPPGYDQRALVSAVRNDSSSDFIDFIQEGLRYNYKAWPTLISGNIGLNWVSLNMAPFVPSALSTFCYGSLGQTATGTGAVANDSTVLNDRFRDRNKYGGYWGTGDVLTIYWQFDIITADTLYALGNSADFVLRIHGFYINKLHG